MTYHYNITQYRPLRGMRLWTDSIFLSALILFTASIAFYNTSAINLLLTLPAIILIAALLKLILSRQKVSFIDINEGTLTYLDTEKSEMISVPVEEITHTSTRFCQLNVHTRENTHKLNLGLIRNEKARWEIKEMIREIARR